MFSLLTLHFSYGVCSVFSVGVHVLQKGCEISHYNHGLFYRLLARHSLGQTWTLKDPLSWVQK